MPKTYESEYASPPEAPAQGDLWFTKSLQASRHDGSNFIPWGQLNKLYLPDLTEFAWINQVDAVANQTYGQVQMGSVATAAHSFHALVKSAPSTPYVIRACFMYAGGKDTRNHHGLVFRQSSDGKLGVFSRNNANETADITHWANPTTLSATPKSQECETPWSCWWMAIEDDGVDRNYLLSVDGRHWEEFYSHGRTTYLTPDQVGFGFNAGHTDCVFGSLILLSWEEA